MSGNGCKGAFSLGGAFYQCVQPFGHGGACINPDAGGGAVWASAVSIDRLADAEPADDADIVDAEVVE